MSKLLITIPSKARPDSIVKDTYSYVQHSTFPFNIFVEPQDYDSYIQAGIDPGCLVNILKNNMGFYYVKNFIKKHCIDNNYKYVFKLDDDVTNVRDVNLRSKGYQGRVDRKDRTLRIFDQLIRDSIELLDKVNQVGGVSIKYGNQLFNYDGEKWASVDKRFNSNYIIRTPHLTFEKPPGYFGLYEDFFTFFNLIVNGYSTVQYGATGLDVKPVGINAGGLQSYDRQTNAANDKIILSEYFPFVVWKEVQGKRWQYEPDVRKSLNKFLILK